MPLSIEDPEADRLARAAAQRAGETLTQAVINALRDRLVRLEQRTQNIDTLIEEVLASGRHCAALPTLDERSDDAILGYDALRVRLSGTSCARPTTTVTPVPRQSV